MAKKKSDLTPIQELSSMPTLKDSGGGLKELTSNIETLKNVYHPGSLPAFQATMQGISERVYKARQAQELGTMSGFMDPSKVSGGTFSNTLGWLEQSRGKSISDTYNSSMNAYTQTQSQLSNDIQNLESMRTNMINNANQFKSDLITKMPGVYETLSPSERKSLNNGTTPASVYSKMDSWSKAVYDREIQWEEQDRRLKEFVAKGGPEAEQVDKFNNDLNGALGWLKDQKSGETEVAGPGNMTSFKRNDKIFNTIDEYRTAVTNLKAKYPSVDDKDIEYALISSLSPDDQLKVQMTASQMYSEEKSKTKLNEDITYMKNTYEALKDVDMEKAKDSVRKDFLKSKSFLQSNGLLNQ